MKDERAETLAIKPNRMDVEVIVADLLQAGHGHGHVGIRKIEVAGLGESLATFEDEGRTGDLGLGAKRSKRLGRSLLIGEAHRRSAVAADNRGHRLQVALEALAELHELKAEEGRAGDNQRGRACEQDDNAQLALDWNITKRTHDWEGQVQGPEAVATEPLGVSESCRSFEETFRCSRRAESRLI